MLLQAEGLPVKATLQAKDLGVCVPSGNVRPVSWQQPRWVKASKRAKKVEQVAQRSQCGPTLFSTGVMPQLTYGAQAFGVAPYCSEEAEDSGCKVHRLP